MVGRLFLFGGAVNALLQHHAAGDDVDEDVWERVKIEPMNSNLEDNPLYRVKNAFSHYGLSTLRFCFLLLPRSIFSVPEALLHHHWCAIIELIRLPSVKKS